MDQAMQGFIVGAAVMSAILLLVVALFGKY